MKAHLRDGLRVDDLGDEALVLDPEGEQVHRVEGDAVAVLRLLTAGTAAGRAVEVPDALRAGLDDLVEAGLVEPPAQWTRRKVLIAGGAAWTAATVTTFGLADPAAAATNCPGGVTPSDPEMTGMMYTANDTYVTGPAGAMASMYNLLVRAWGAGGGGGGGSSDSTGGGGGGGEYRSGLISVTECTSYAITVGAGGGGGGMPGGTGGNSSFAGLLVAIGGAGGTEPDSGMGSGGAGGTGGTGGTTANAGGMGGNGSDDTFVENSGTGGGGGGAGGEGGPGGDGTNGATMNNEGMGGAGGAGIPGGGAGGNGGDDSNAPTTPGIPGGGGGGAEEATFGASGGSGARGEVWVGV